MLSTILRHLFFGLIIRPIVMLALGLNVRNRIRLPKDGPAIIIANHNSHLDTMVLMTLLPINILNKVHPVAAADYFLRNRFLAWFALSIVGIIPLDRQIKGMHKDPLAGASEALSCGKILILFPEGSRGEPEQMSILKNGISHLAKRHPDVPTTPIFLHGLGKALPKGEAILVPFFCDVFVGKPLFWQGSRQQYMTELNNQFDSLADQFPHSDECS
ncbi:MAG: lysophospholipid acyltransferase family protein [Mariprofundaceae bacterium]|nr:lysophospholipid acyltransferase family protein [Mariprofundaceae bacterium]